MYTVGSLYAGVGGICMGFMNSGMEVKWANEYDRNACYTYRSNFHHKLYEEDIWKLEPEELDKIDILVGGFPCQPFSVAGYMKGFEDERGNHFFRIMHYAKVLKPKVIFLENVKNLYGHDKGKTFRIIKETVDALGYTFTSKILNSKDYGDIPQNRERVYMVCFMKNGNNTSEYNEYFRFPSPIKLTKSIDDLIEQKQVDEKYYYRENKYMYPLLVDSVKNPDTIYQWRRQYVRENKQKVCPTLTANMGTGGHNVPLIITRNGFRKLTPRECFNFQGFPKDFVLPDIAPSQLYKQAGNSVTVPVIQRIAENIKNALDLKPLPKIDSKLVKGSVLEEPTLF